MAEKLRLLDLFSGIGGFSAGLERSGAFDTVAFCEIEEFPRRVIKRHWPSVPCYHDIRELTAARLAADGITVDAICGGFPCQDLSCAGNRNGLNGERSGLWREYYRLICEIRPKVAFVENVAGLLTGPRGTGEWFGCLLGDLAEIRYDAEWCSIRASDIGAPHKRDRIWIVAYPNEVRRHTPVFDFIRKNDVQARQEWSTTAYSDWRNVERWLKSSDASYLWETADAKNCGVDDGVPEGLDALAIGALGNAVVPHIPHMIGDAYRRWAMQ